MVSVDAGTGTGKRFRPFREADQKFDAIGKHDGVNDGRRAGYHIHFGEASLRLIDAVIPEIVTQFCCLVGFNRVARRFQIGFRFRLILHQGGSLQEQVGKFEEQGPNRLLLWSQRGL